MKHYTNIDGYTLEEQYYIDDVIKMCLQDKQVQDDKRLLLYVRHFIFRDCEGYARIAYIRGEVKSTNDIYSFRLIDLYEKMYRKEMTVREFKEADFEDALLYEIA